MIFALAEVLLLGWEKRWLPLGPRNIYLINDISIFLLRKQLSNRLSRELKTLLGDSTRVPVKSIHHTGFSPNNHMPEESAQN